MHHGPSDAEDGRPHQTLDVATLRDRRATIGDAAPISLRCSPSDWNDEANVGRCPPRCEKERAQRRWRALSLEGRDTRQMGKAQYPGAVIALAYNGSEPASGSKVPFTAGGFYFCLGGRRSWPAATSLPSSLAPTAPARYGRHCAPPLAGRYRHRDRRGSWRKGSNIRCSGRVPRSAPRGKGA